MGECTVNVWRLRLENEGKSYAEPSLNIRLQVMGMLIGFEMADSPMDMSETSSTFGVTLTPLEEVVRRQASGA